MIGCKVSVFPERSSIIQIPKNSMKSNNIYKKETSYDLKQNCFDPSKSSPPNRFMLKLHQRMYNYDFTEIKDFNFDKE
jgi:hypothetical protein